jgi:hypothetical protein
MTMNQTIRGVGATARVAATSAPYVRRIMTDDEIHAALRDVAGAANDLVGHITHGSPRDILTDPAVRSDLANIVGSVQHGAERLTEKPRRSFVRRLLGITLVVVAAAGLVAGALIYPRTRQVLTRGFEGLRARLGGTTGSDAGGSPAPTFRDEREPGPKPGQPIVPAEPDHAADRDALTSEADAAAKDKDGKDAAEPA